MPSDGTVWRPRPAALRGVLESDGSLSGATNLRPAGQRRRSRNRGLLEKTRENGIFRLKLREID